MLLGPTACTNYDLGTVSGDTNTYVSVSTVDPNKHVGATFVDALGRTVYTQQDSGLYGQALTVNQQKTIAYNAVDQPTSVLVTDEVPQSGQSIVTVTTTAQYDDLGRLTQVSDPDRGTHYYTYDADGRLRSDVVGTHTLGYNDDLLGRVGCVQDAAPTINATGACSAGHPYVQNTYDTTELGTQGSTDFPVGRLTQSVATTYFPEGTSATATQKRQYDQRGRTVTAQLALGLPSAWNVTTALPTYQAAVSYNDADQVTTTTTSTIPTGQGYTTTVAYDSTGAPSGLSNNTGDTPDLATLVYNASARLDTINFQTNSGSAPALAGEQFSYDANLRPTTTNATWLGNSGNTGTILSQSRSYDNAGNVISLTTTQAAVPNQAGSGGSETQNFCYDEQNRLVWAGNSGTQPAAGNGTCGSGTLASGLSGAGYSSSVAYTHLGQLWQGPLNGSGAAQQYLYCDSTHPHQLKGLYPAGTSCTNPTGASYSALYDAWGNVTSRTSGGTTATLTYDVLDHLVTWNAGSTNQAWYAYDASGHRVLSRSTTGSGTSITTYAFGLEEHLYSATGSNTGNTYYYVLGGRLIGELTGTTTLSTQFFLTDALGSVLATFSATVGSAAVLGNQVYGPYGNQRYNKGTMGTAKGYTGQYGDGTGLDYYNARYYDPVVGLFISADTVQDNFHGFDPYAYVGGNPETWNDPTGHWGWSLLNAVVTGLVIGVGVVAVGAVLAGSVAALPVIAAGFALGYLGSEATSAVINIATNGLPTNEQQWDTMSQQGLVSGLIGGAVGAFSAWAGFAGASAWEAMNTSRFFTPSLQNLSNVSTVASMAAGTIGTVAGTIAQLAIYPPHHTQRSQPQNSGQHPSSSSGTSPSRSAPLPPVQGSSRPASPTSGSLKPPMQPGVPYYTVVSGDTLWGIATRFYGSGLQWQRIYQANIVVNDPKCVSNFCPQT